MTIELSNFYSAGYFLVRRASLKWLPVDHPLSGVKILSLSDEICPHFVVKWGIFKDFQSEALDFGLPAEKLDEFLAWCLEVGNTDPWKVFDTSEAARQFIQRFKLPTADLHLIGVGIPHLFEERLWNEPSTRPTSGSETLIERHLSMEEGGRPLGFEVITYEYSDFAFSWLSGLTYARRDIEKTCGIRPNTDGMIDTFEEAMIVYEWIEDTSEGRRGEPVPYDVTLLVDYPLEISQPSAL